MIPAATIARLAGLGLSAEHTAAVAEMMAEVEAATEAKAGAAIASRRAADRERKARQRHGTSRGVTGQDVTSADRVDPPPLPPGPPIPTPRPVVIPPSPPSEAPAPKGADRGRGSRISADWRLDDIGRAYSVSQGLTASEITAEAARFRDYWLAKAGSDGRKADWAAAWRTWARNAVDRRGRSNGPRAGPANEPRNSHLAALDAASDLFARN